MTVGRAVAIGGGHGLSAVLSGLTGRCHDLTGVVSVADDGGSSGRLRRDLGIPAPGDMRRCLAALTPDGLLRDALEHRFDHGVLAGHPAGNVLLSAMLELDDDPVRVMRTICRAFGALGLVLPATAGPIDLLAATSRGTVKGQVAISESAEIDALRFDPPDPQVPEAVVEAIIRADVIVLGPGSLYSSVLAPVVPGVAAAIKARRGPLVYVANLGDDPGETPGYTLGDLVDAVERHGVEPDIVIADTKPSNSGRHSARVRSFEMTGVDPGVHDPERLGEAIAVVCSST